LDSVQKVGGLRLGRVLSDRCCVERIGRELREIRFCFYTSIPDYSRVVVVGWGPVFSACLVAVLDA
jgi:hypothetical protein